MGCLAEAQQHFERIKHFHDSGGPYGLVPATYYHEKLGECRARSVGNTDAYAESHQLLGTKLAIAVGIDGKSRTIERL